MRTDADVPRIYSYAWLFKLRYPKYYCYIGGMNLSLVILVLNPILPRNLLVLPHRFRLIYFAPFYRLTLPYGTMSPPQRPTFSRPSGQK